MRNGRRRTCYGPATPTPQEIATPLLPPPPRRLVFRSNPPLSALSRHPRGVVWLGCLSHSLSPTRSSPTRSSPTRAPCHAAGPPTRRDECVARERNGNRFYSVYHEISILNMFLWRRGGGGLYCARKFTHPPDHNESKIVKEGKGGGGRGCDSHTAQTPQLRNELCRFSNYDITIFSIPSTNSTVVRVLKN